MKSLRTRYKRLREWTLSADNINRDLMVYVNRIGKLISITPVGSAAGSDWYYHLLELYFEP